jgi:hypothetical protein
VGGALFGFPSQVGYQGESHNPILLNVFIDCEEGMEMFAAINLRF